MALEHAAGIIRPIDPLDWPALARRVRAVEGWVPPMLLIAAFGVFFFTRQGFGLLGHVAAVRAFNLVALATWFGLGTLLCLAVTIDGLRNLRRLAVFGIVRPRWWFELARLSWMTLLFAGLGTPLLDWAIGPPAAGLTFRCVPAASIAFMVFATGGYLMSFLARRPRRGRAFECVEWFYVLFGLICGATVVAVALPANAPWVQATIVAVSLVAVVLLTAAVLTICRRWERHVERMSEFDDSQVS